jgi:hypothetical protein
LGAKALLTEFLCSQFGVKEHLFLKFFRHPAAPAKEKKSSPYFSGPHVLPS